MMAQYNAANNTSIIKAGTPRRMPRPLSSLYGATPRRQRRAPLPWRDDLPADHQYADLLAGQAAGHVAGISYGPRRPGSSPTLLASTPPTYTARPASLPGGS